MNERIRKLANQMFSMEQFEYAEEFLNDEFMEQFAKLVVRECCDIFVELRTRPADLAVKDVKKHFGVEE